MDREDTGDTQQEETNPTSGEAKKKKTTTTKRRRKQQLNPNKARDERRSQLVQLRKEAEELEWTLKKWQDLRAAHRLMKRRRPMIAIFLLCGRRYAEHENFRLKEQVKERLMVKEMAQSEGSRRLRRTNLPPGYIQRMAATLFEELAAGMQVCYYLGANTPVPADVRPHTPLLRGGLKGEERRFFDRRLVPFSMEVASNAWWRDWHSYRGHASEHVGDVVVESFGLEMNDFRSKSSVTCYGQQILRRETEDTRTVFVWNTYLEPFEFDGERVKGIYFLEQYHMLVKPDEAEEEDGGEVCTRMSVCYVVTPYFLDLTLRSDPKIGKLIDFLVGALFSNLKAANDRIEDLLLDQGLQKYSRSVGG
ncbi:hypothetical protein PHYSODRAFT_258843 [Phytophthora sojae]|uniref:START domain-containing protein n=1 Tax=Phytophthora sojae (strain P6497) TaxID=1094619 RepID=G5A525_PHYSP|nr:hypothetical protein PHYSODRAFT_258843 [Phytophthora sojae]EGZ09774.1 hypothetical protein PHYSODRAFT_258843 [Phytophthora sojae]|eukprot:XP_009534635.1 hypothetical protein PHYSODRAFT_258843 [Phytophthora sojae]